MDFSGRGPQQNGYGNGQQFSEPAAKTSAVKKSAVKTDSKSKLVLWGSGVLGLLILTLVVALIVAIGFSNHSTEGTYVDNSKLQAVFLQTGQVYFGNIKSLNNKYVVLDNIYYLQTASGSTSATSTNSNTNVSLVKLGCELHSPYDQMVINRDQVTFWENLHADGQVAKAVATFQKDNPSGQKCTDQSAAPNSSTNVQGSTNTTTNTNSSSSTSTGKQ